MKTLRLFIVFITFTGFFLSSCSTNIEEDNSTINTISLEDVMSRYDLWYVDYNKTIGNGDIPFVSKAFTLSFIDGVMYANNNIVEVGNTGRGFGIDVGTYNTFNGILEIDHDLDRFNEFEIKVISNNEIRLFSLNENVNYYLIGYNINQFDYDKLFYDNIEYFLQEYVAWKKTNTKGVEQNIFDNENFLAFTPENITTFYSSQDNQDTRVDDINWDYVGDYEIFDVNGYINLKILTLFYDRGDVEEFELTVLNDHNIELFNVDSKKIYNYTGKKFIQHLKIENKLKNVVSNKERKRTKVERRLKNRRN